jgi:lipoic acid synthetase
MLRERKPTWLRVQPPAGPDYVRLKHLLRDLNLHTVCEEAHCPNVGECWGEGTATVMLLGDVCTRGCRFCAVASGNPRGAVDPFEPVKVAKAVDELGLTYVVLTSVDRDDLPDGGAAHFAATVRAIKVRNPAVIVETLIPDFQGVEADVAKVVDAGPEVVDHNVETVERLQGKVRDRRATYDRSLRVLRAAKERNPSVYTKSSIMLGLGERDEEVLQTFRDLRAAGVDIVTLGQYLRPSEWHLPVVEYVSPDKFAWFRERAEAMGFLYCASGPLVRSSYRAGEFFMENVIRRRRGSPAVQEIVPHDQA